MVVIESDVLRLLPISLLDANLMERDPNVAEIESTLVNLPTRAAEQVKRRFVYWRTTNNGKFRRASTVVQLAPRMIDTGARRSG